MKTCINFTELYLQVNYFKIQNVCCSALNSISCLTVVPLHGIGLNIAHYCGYKAGLRFIFVVSGISSDTGEYHTVLLALLLNKDLLKLENFVP